MFSVSMSLDRTIQINKPIHEVYTSISDFRNWTHWSPWLCQEPKCQYQVQGSPGEPGHKQSWDGQFIGSGNMVIREASKPKQIQYDLSFLKPFKSQARVAFHLEDRQGQTQVRWTMDSSLPIFIIFMKKMMTALVGNDYERGLQMLKEYLETGRVLTRVDFKGIVPRKGFFYVGRRTSCAISECGPVMEKDFGDLQGLAKASQIPQPEFGFSFYHKYDMVKGECEFTTGFAFASATPAPKGWVSGEIPEHQALEVDHYGTYQHLGNGWRTAFGRQRALKAKLLKNIPWYEVYRNPPGTVSDDKLLTEICLPVRHS